MNWTHKDKEGEWPKARDDHAASYDTQTGRMFIFGGYVEGGKSNDLWKLDIKTT